MGRRRTDTKQGELTFSGPMADEAGRVPARDHGCVFRSTGAARGLHDGQPVRENRDHQQHLRVFHRPRSQPDAGLATDPGDGAGMVPGPTGTIDQFNTCDAGADWRSESERRRQHDHTKSIPERGQALNSRIEQPSGVGESPDPDSSNGRDRPDADVSGGGRLPSNPGNPADCELFQSENLSRFDSYGQDRISYRSSI